MNYDIMSMIIKKKINYFMNIYYLDNNDHI